MKVILLGELRGKGGEGDVVDVAQGYAENYLFPNRMAIAATPGNIKQLEERRHNIAKREERRIADAEATKAALDGKRVLINVKVGEEGQLYGSVTTAMIAEAVEAQLGVIIDRKRSLSTCTARSTPSSGCSLATAPRLLPRRPPRPSPSPRSSRLRPRRLPPRTPSRRF